MNIKITSVLALALSLMAGSAFAADDTKPIQIGYSNFSNTDTFTTMVQTRFKKLVADSGLNWQISYQDAHRDVNAQVDQVETFVAQNCKVIVISAVDSSGSVAAVDVANKANIPIIGVIIPLKGGKVTYIGNSNENAGELVAKFMNTKLPPNAKIVVIEGQPGTINSIQRVETFKKKLNRPDVQILAESAADWQRAKGMKLMEDWIEAFPKIDGVMAANDDMALGAIEALKGANRLNGVTVAGYGGTKDAMRAVKDGTLSITMYYNAQTQAQNLFNAIKKILDENLKELPDQYGSWESVTSENVATYLKDVYGE